MEIEKIPDFSWHRAQKQKTKAEPEERDENTRIPRGLHRRNRKHCSNVRKKNYEIFTRRSNENLRGAVKIENFFKKEFIIVFREQNVQQLVGLWNWFIVGGGGEGP